MGRTLTHRSNELTQHTCPALIDSLEADPLYAVSPSQIQDQLFHRHRHNTKLQLQLYINAPVERVVYKRERMINREVSKMLEVLMGLNSRPLKLTQKQFPS